MPLSSSHWFRVTGSGTFLLMMMVVVALFAVQSSMAHPSSTSTFRPSIHEYQEKQANRSALTHSGSLANSSQLNVSSFLKVAFSSGDDSNLGGDDPCTHANCNVILSESICVNGKCYCPIGYVNLLTKCMSAPCDVDHGCEQWNNTYCDKNSKCVCLDCYEPHPELSRCVAIANCTPSTTSTTSTTSTPSSTTPVCNDCKCLKCGQHSVCVNQGPFAIGACQCEVGYIHASLSIGCTQYNCTEDGQRGNCSKWPNSYCNASEQLCVCKPGFEQRLSNEFKCQPILGWTTTSTTSSATSSTAPTSSSPPSTTSTTEFSITKTKTSYGSSKRTVMIVGIVVLVSMLAITLLYIFGCHFCRTEAKIGDTSGANYRRQAYQPSPANSKATTKANSKVSSNANSKATSKATSKAASKATSKVTSKVISKITSKINSAKTTSKY